MSIYENQVCPVCSREFVDDDDIVVCPECGTPHHRECYNMIGHCVNRGLHKADYDYNEEIKQSKAEEGKTASQASNDYHNEKEEKENSSNAIPNPFSIPNIDSQFENDREKIDGEDISDIAITVRVNANRFVPKFKELDSKNKKASWNWSAFIFGSFYLLYRKMYQFGVGIFALLLALFYGTSALIYKVAPEFMNAIAGLAEMTQQRITPTNEQIEAVMSCADVNKAAMVVYGMLGIIFIIHFIIGIFADGLYKKHVVSIIKAYKQSNQSSFSQASYNLNSNGLEMSEEQLKKIYLSRKGGTSFMAPTFALLVLSIIL